MFSQYHVSKKRNQQSLCCFFIVFRLGPQQALDTHTSPESISPGPPSPELPSPEPPSLEPQPPKPTSRIPKKLWYKLGPKGLNEKTQAWTDTCIKNNTDYEAVFLNDSAADAYVLRTFGASNPDLVDLYLNLTVPIFKADILRYLLLFAEGGVYNDLDVSCEVPIDEWIPAEYKADASVVVGWEFDGGFGDNILRQFATWTMMAEPRSPHLWRVVEDTLRFFQAKMREHDVPPQGLTLEMIGDVVDGTGPRRVTRNFLKSFREFNTTLADIRRIEEPRLVGDVLVLPGYSFAASMNRYPDMEVVPPPLVRHHYAGTWKNENGGEVA
ncbi:glycosyltransferase family 32 protein [Sodiomyces alcalophilus JCM 7366]|uniref:glycosyltransferase family 32 protein n=1 Tax=Sodiomyces alcalophilus JCM 7366 TaxID=591952 RepID=UPI0039B3D336